MAAIDPRLLRRARATRTYLILSVLVGTSTAILVVLQAWLLSTALGDTFHNHTVATALSLAPALVAVVGGRAVLSWLHTVLATRASAAVKSQLRNEILQARLSHADHGGPDTGTLVTLLTQGLDALDGYYARYLPQLVLAVTVPIVVGAAILSSDVISAITVAVTLPLIPIFMILVGWATQARVRRRWRIQSRLSHHFADLMAGLPTLQVFGRAKAQAEGLRRTNEDHRQETMGTLRVSFLSALVLELLATLSVALVAVSIGLRVVDGNLSLTIGLFVLILAPEAYLPLRQVGVHYHDAADGMAAAEKAFELLDASPAADQGRRPVPDLSESIIEFSGVSVRYPGADRDALSELNLVVGPAEVVVLVGASGAGKSTALSLLMGFHRPDAGQITIGGVPLDELDQRDWRSRLGWVAQLPGLISGTVADNVLMGAAGAPRRRVEAALQAAGAGHLDPDREVAERGGDLSAGEIRRVALARALLRIDCGGGQLLILDEPTAGLDSEIEGVAIATLRRLGVGVVVVSHREAVIAAADRVVEIFAAVQVPALTTGPAP